MFVEPTQTTQATTSASPVEKWNAHHPINWEVILALRFRFIYQVSNATDKLALLSEQEGVIYTKATTKKHMEEILEAIQVYQHTEPNSIERPRPM